MNCCRLGVPESPAILIKPHGSYGRMWTARDASQRMRKWTNPTSPKRPQTDNRQM
jgi:hypothetical protein